MKTFLLKVISCVAFIICISNVNAQNTWLQKANLTADTSRQNATGFSIGHYGYIGLGQTPNGVAHDFWRWNQRNNTWTRIADYPGAGKYGVTSFSIGGHGYCCCGWSGSANENDLWEYDTTTNSWTQKANFPGPARYGAFAFVLGNKAYVGCGEPNGQPYDQDVYMYNSITNTWTAVANFPGGDRTSLCAFTLNGYGYAGGGENGTTSYNTIWKYDTTTNIWTSIASMPAPGSGIGGPVSFVLDTLAYVGTGIDHLALTFHRDFWSYSSTTNTWSSIATLPGVSRWLGVGFAIGNKGYAGTGIDSVNGALPDYWEYTPFAAPVAMFTESDTMICVGDTVRFTDMSTNSPISWKWTFEHGNPATSTLQNPVVVYNTAGTDSVKLVAKNGSGSDSVTKKTCIHVRTCGAGIENTSDNNSMSLYPNPANNTINLAFTNAISGNAKIEITDITGRLISSQLLNASVGKTISMNISGMASGMYIVKVTAGNTVYFEKFIKQ